MAAAGGAAHGFRGVSQRGNGTWHAQKGYKLNGKQVKLHNGQNHVTAEEAAHAYDCMLYFLEDDPDYNLPERMTADVKNTLAQHRDVFEYLEAQKKLFKAKADANFRKGASKYRGVSLSSGRWRIHVQMPGGRLRPYFNTELEAAHNYDRHVIRRDGRNALLNFPLATYAAEFSEAELDAIDARVAAGKPPPPTGTAAATKKKGKGKAPAAAAKPRQQHGGGVAEAAAAAEGEAGGSGGGSGGAAEEVPEYEDWEEEWEEEEAATIQDDPSTWTREQREAYRFMHPFDDIFTPEELDELEDDVQRLSIRDDFEDFKREKRQEIRRACETRVAGWAALLEEVRGTEDEPYVAADLAQSQRELDSWEEQVPSKHRLWAMFEEEEMERYNEFLRKRIIQYPLTFAKLSEDHWFDPQTGQPNMAAMQGALAILESDLPQAMKAMQDDDEKDAYVVKLLRIRRFLDAQGIEQPGRSADELVQLRWALGRDEDVEEEDPEEGYGVFDASDEEEEPAPVAAFPPDFFRDTVETLLGGIVDATHGIFQRAENGPAAAADQPPNAPPNPRYASPAAAGAASGSAVPEASPTEPGSGSAAATTTAQPAAAAPAPASAAIPAAAASGPASTPAFSFSFGSGGAPPTTFGGFTSAGAGGSAAPFQFGSGAAPPATFGGFGGASGASGGPATGGPASASVFGFGSGAAPPATFGGFGGLSSSGTAAAGPFAFGASGSSTSAGAGSAPAPASFVFPPYPGTSQPPAGRASGGGGAGGSAGASGGARASDSAAGGSVGASASGSTKPPAPSGWLNIENFGDQAAADPQVRADWQYEMALATPSGPGGQFTTEQYAQMLANILQRERQRQAEGHLPGWNGAPDIRSEEEQEAAAEAEEAAWAQEKAAIDARMAELERDGARLVRRVKNYTYDVGEHVRENRFHMMMTYWEGQCLAHLRAGHIQWLEDLLGPNWLDRIKEVGVTTPHLFGTHNCRDSLPPIDPTPDIIFMEMTGWVANTPIGEGLASMMGWTRLPTLDDPTLALWFHTICEQARLGLPTIGLAPVEHWSPTCTKWDWRKEMKDKRKKFTCSHPWLFLQRMRPVHLGLDYPPGTPDVVCPSVQRAMRQSAGEREAMQLRAAEEVAELVQELAAAAEAGVQAGRMHHGVASVSAS